MPEKVPLWVIENTFGTFGNRWGKRAETLGEDLKTCETCGEEMYHFRDWNYCGELYYCNACVIPARKIQSERWTKEADERRNDWMRQQNYGRSEESEWRRERGSYIHGAYQPPEVPATEAQVPLGNLDEYLYQYWIGCLDEKMPARVMSSRSTCRACGTVVFGSLGRTIHKMESKKLYTGDYSCMKVLAEAIRNMVSLHNCMVCKNYTTKKHYGVPLCSPPCHKVWRFAERMQYPELDKAIAPFWMAVTPETGGSSILESSLSQTETALYPGEEE